jgi:hypothetical protein
MINKIIRNYLIKQTAGRTDDGIMITLRDPQKVELLENVMADLLMRYGIDPRAITSEAQLKGFLNQIEAMTKQSATTSGIKNTQSAKVFDLEGNKLDPNKPIMGGTQEGMFDNIFNKMQNERKGLKAIDDDLPPPGSRGGPDDIAAPIQSAEESLKDMTEAEIKKKIEESNKKGIANIKKKLDDDPEKKADGGRIGLKEGSGMNRRTFLKFLAGAASIPIIGKIFKPLKVGKTVSKVPIIKTADVEGKPEWFDSLVNRVILEGDDVTKQFATGERQVVHMKVLEEGTGGKKFPPGTPGSDDTSIIVTQDLDAGAVKVEYRNPENVYGDPVQMQYKKPLPDEDMPRGGAAEFNTAESGPVGRAFGPDDYEIEIDELGGTSISDLTSDVSKLKQYATGKKPTLKEIVQIKKRKDKAKAISEGGEDEMQAVIDRQGEYIQFDDIDPGDYASGGIARMLGE